MRRICYPVLANISFVALITGEIIIDTSNLVLGGCVEISFSLFKDFENFRRDGSFYPYLFEQIGINHKTKTILFKVSKESFI